MKTRVLTGAVILILTVGFVLLKQFSPYIFDAFLLVIMYGITYETIKAYKQANKPVNQVLLYLFPVIVLGFSIFATGMKTFYTFFGIVLFVLLYIILLVIEDVVVLSRKRKSGEQAEPVLFEHTINTMFVLAYPLLTFSFMFLLNHSEYSLSYMGIILSFAVAMLTDTCAYLFGKACGKHKLIPEVSPHKTIEGAIGGLFGGLLGAVSCFFIFYYTNFFNLSKVASFGTGFAIFIVIGIVGSLLDQIGDLVESAFKRKVGVKDLGKIFPGHGGFMDRVDGLMFSSIAVYLLMTLLYVI